MSAAAAAFFFHTHIAKRPREQCQLFGSTAVIIEQKEIKRAPLAIICRVKSGKELKITQQIARCALFRASDALVGYQRYHYRAD
jgi:hypothetical protein